MRRPRRVFTLKSEFFDRRYRMDRMEELAGFDSNNASHPPAEDRIHPVNPVHPVVGFAWCGVSRGEDVSGGFGGAIFLPAGLRFQRSSSDFRRDPASSSLNVFTSCSLCPFV